MLIFPVKLSRTFLFTPFLISKSKVKIPTLTIIVDQKYDPPYKNSSLLYFEYITSTNNAACKDEY